MAELKEENTVTISFTILDDLEDIKNYDYETDTKLSKIPLLPYHKQIQFTKTDIEKFINEVRLVFALPLKLCYFNDRIYNSEIVDELYNDNFYVLNRIEKYYVVAFAINYTRFEIYSKDCDKKLISWRENDESDPIAKNGILYDDDYNICPVETLLKQIS